MHELLAHLKQLHSADGIRHLIDVGGLYALIGIVFAETGLLAGFFLPGDSLLITAGVLSNPLNPNHLGSLDPWILNFALFLSAVVGNQCGFGLGHRAGERVWQWPDSRFYKRAHLESAKEFYEKHGRLSMVGARFVPIIRTFVPFVAGMARMAKREFLIWNLIGGALWITSLIWVGYFLGQTSFANRLDKLIVVVILVSFLPMFIASARKAMSRVRAPQ